MSVTGASLNAAGELELALSEGGPIAVGNVKGQPGNDGVSVTGASINAGGSLNWLYQKAVHSLLAM